jgi:hypothetical protein
MNRHSYHRLLAGVPVVLILVAVLIVHLKGLVKLDNVALALLAGIAAVLAFAFADWLGIRKISAGSASVELAIQAAEAIQKDQQGPFSQVLNSNADLFPALGARVLWVDDHPQLLIAHRQVLRRLGIEVIFVTSTKEAIRELERDSDFTLLIQDHLRHGSTDDARNLARWTAGEGRPKYKLLAPLIVYTFDSFDESVGVPERDWIIQNYSILLSRVVKELRRWRDRFPDPQGKSPAV